MRYFNKDCVCRILSQIPNPGEKNVAFLLIQGKYLPWRRGEGMGYLLLSGRKRGRLEHTLHLPFF